ncbi:MAG: HEAT repeat domain-containing protein [Burkholderiaceae bacterium]
MLRAIWVVSFLLFIVSAISVVVLLLLRSLRRKRERDEKAVNARLSKQIVVWLHEPDADIAQLREAASRTPRRAGELLTRALELLQGEDQARLVQLGRELGLETFMLRELTSGRPAERLEAAEKLAFFHTDDVADALSRALDDPYPPLRLAAARSLAALGRNVPSLALRDPQWGDSALVDDLFEKLATRQSQDFIDLAGDTEVTSSRRVAALRALAGTGDYALLPVFSRLAEDSHPDLRVAAAAGLGRLGHPKAQSALARLFDDKEYLVRAAAVQAVGAIQLGGLYQDMARLLDDEEWWVRLATAEALAKGGEQGRRILRLAHDTGSADARDMAAVALLEYGEKNG